MQRRIPILRPVKALIAGVNLLLALGYAIKRELGADFVFARGVYVDMRGGLANQIISYRAAYMLSHLTRWPIVLDLTRYGEFGSRTYQLSFLNPTFDLSIHTLSSRRRWLGFVSDPLKPLLLKPLAGSSPDMPKADAFIDQLLRSSTAPILLDIDSALFLRSSCLSFFRRNKNLEPFKLTSTFPESSHQRFFDSIVGTGTASVACHVRRTDLLTHLEGAPASAELYNKAIRYVESRIQSAVFFVFTDDIQWCRLNLSFASMAYYSPVDSPESGYIDLLFASRCYHKILTEGSTFSEMIDALSPFYDTCRLLLRCDGPNNHINMQEYYS